MGESLSTLNMWEKDPKYNGVKDKLRNLDKDNKKLVGEFLLEQDKVQFERDRLKKQLDKLQILYSDLNEQMNKQRNDNLNNKPTMSEKEQSKLSTTTGHTTTRMVDGLLDEQKKLTTDIQRQQTEIQTLQNENEMLTRVNEKLRIDNKILSTEKQNALSRLETSIQTTDPNSVLSELCDVNRPARLAENFDSLYTEERTTAFNELASAKATAYDNCKIDKELCNIAKTCYTICQNIERKQMTEIEVHAWDIACVLHKHPDQLLYSAHTGDLIDPFLIEPLGIKESNFDSRMTAIHKCKDAIIQIVIERRSYDKQLLEYVKQAIVRHFEHINKLGSNGAVINYVKKCAELCWKMVIKSPPMILVCDQMEGTPVDKNMFSYHINTGPIVDFVVWPALLLHMGGPVLQKGVVQGKKEMKFKFNTAQVCSGKPISE